MTATNECTSTIRNFERSFQFNIPLSALCHRCIFIMTSSRLFAFLLYVCKILRNLGI